MSIDPLEMGKTRLRLGMKILTVGKKFLMVGWIGGILLGGMGETLGAEAVGGETHHSPPPPPPRLTGPESPPLTSPISAPPCVNCRIPAPETSYQEYRPPQRVGPPQSYPPPQGYPLPDYARPPSYSPAQGDLSSPGDRPGNCYLPRSSGLFSPLFSRGGCCPGQEGAGHERSPYGPDFPGTGYRPGLLTPLLMWLYFPGWCTSAEQGACFPECSGFPGQAGFPWQPGFPHRLNLLWRPKISSSAQHRGYYGDLYMWIVVPNR